MNPRLKKVLRTFQTNFPQLLEIKFAVVRRYRMWRRIPFERDFEALALFPNPEDAVYLDVGANRGQSTDAILLATHAGQIHQFEPNPLLCQKLARLFGEHPRVTIHAFGLADESREQPLHIPYYKNWMFDGLGSFDGENPSDWLSTRVHFFRETHVRIEQVPCKLERLDQLGLRPYFMKLDIQGYEFHALRGAEQTIRACEPIILLESPLEPRIADFLGQLGYAWYAFRDGAFHPREVGRQNTFLMTPSKSKLVEIHIRREGTPRMTVAASGAT
jgi:FkbM family methyltransferase